MLSLSIIFEFTYKDQEFMISILHKFTEIKNLLCLNNLNKLMEPFSGHWLQEIHYAAFLALGLRTIFSLTPCRGKEKTIVDCFVLS